MRSGLSRLLCNLQAVQGREMGKIWFYKSAFDNFSHTIISFCSSLTKFHSFSGHGMFPAPWSARVLSARDLCKGYPVKDIDVKLSKASTEHEAATSLSVGRAAHGKKRRFPISVGILPCTCSSPVSRTCSKARSSSEQWDNFLSPTKQQTFYFLFFSEVGKA